MANMQSSTSRFWTNHTPCALPLCWVRGIDESLSRDTTVLDGFRRIPAAMVSLCNHTALDLPWGKLPYPPEQLCLAAVSESTPARGGRLPAPGVAEPQADKKPHAAPGSVEWML
ncbi:hypothetical protein CYMTET_38783 [Cymbomonas tetramitiformis]|uniref:Uncharacterized protein n=1 Tax=Cymbomonas tetramitiformis TaxID=36881 RepID=A0AAE0CBC8_9CHLO|nr:hypothetical protein CYMTET_38783 [Cymbomonas tetramitiformis]